MTKERLKYILSKCNNNIKVDLWQTNANTKKQLEVLSWYCIEVDHSNYDKFIDDCLKKLPDFNLRYITFTEINNLQEDIELLIVDNWYNTYYGINCTYLKSSNCKLHPSGIIRLYIENNGKKETLFASIIYPSNNVSDSDIIVKSDLSGIIIKGSDDYD